MVMPGMRAPLVDARARRQRQGSAVIVVSQTAAKVRRRVAPLSCCGAREHHARQIRSARALGYGRAVRRRASVLLAVSAAACSSPGAQVALPATDGAQSALWLADTDEGLRGYALDLAQPIDPEVRVVREGVRPVLLTVVLYPGPLAAAGLEPGPLELDVARGRPPAALPGATAWTRSYDDDEPTPWLPAAAWPTAPVVRRSPCGTLTQLARLELPEDRAFVLAARSMADGSVLVVAAPDRRTTPELLRLRATPQPDGRSVWSLASLATLPLSQTQWARGGEDAWVVGTSSVGTSSTSELWRLDARAQVMSREALPMHADRVDVAGDGQFVLSGRDVWHRRGTGTWAPLERPTLPDVSGPLMVVATGAAEAWVLFPAGPTVVHYVDAMPRAVWPVAMEGERVSGLFVHPELGPLVLGFSGRAFAVEGWPLPAAEPTWRPLSGGAPGLFASAVLPFPGGLWLGGADGTLAELHAGFGRCAEQPQAGLNIYELLALPGGILVVTGVGTTTGVPLYILSWSRPS
jgi:hypothetical protein